MIYYIIKHKLTGQIMPQAKRNRGYSHWNPSTEKKMTEAMDIPRLINGLAKAKRCISQWVAVPNGKRSMRQSSFDGDYDDIVDIKPDGRKKEDLEVVKVIISRR